MTSLLDPRRPGLLALLALASSGCCPAIVTLEPTEASRTGAEFCVVVAETQDELVLGLMGQEPLMDGHGLLLRLPGQQEACIRNTGVAFAIDAAFADDRGEIRRIEREIPADDAQLRCDPRVREILEVRAGALVDVRVGDRLVTP